jgi:site-specific DNA-methyltransferase (adenine-specific)
MLTNELHYGDNLEIIQRSLLDESVDLIYLDPPFNSQRAYNIIFQDKTGREPAAQIEAFGDTWSWGEEAQNCYDELMQSIAVPSGLKETMRAFKSFLDQTDLMAYLAMMAIRLVELHRVLKKTGSLYLHCDPTASHYLKMILDQVFGTKQFLSEIAWCYSERELSKRYWNHKHDTIFFYVKDRSSGYTFNWQSAMIDYSAGTYKKFSLIDDEGRYYQLRGRNIKGSPYIKKHGLPKAVESESPELVYRDYIDMKKGVPPRDWFTDIPIINRAAKERLGYPTQKPVALLERLIQASSNPGDVVMDPFCGCGTAVVAAEKLGRHWIGIDITYIAVALIKKRLAEQFPDAHFTEHGIPRSAADARILFQQSPIEFQKWAVSILGGQPHQRQGGGDRGIDGLLYFQDYERAYHKVIVEVKGGGYQPKDIRALKSVIDREQSPLGILVALENPTKGMLTEASALGKWKLPGGQVAYPVLQIFTIEDYFNGIRPRLPDTSGTLKSSVRTLAAREITSKIEGI